MIIAFTISLLIGLILLSYVDMISFRLPDSLTLPLIGLGLVHGYLTGEWAFALIGAIAGYLCFVAIELVFKAVRQRDGLGRGDAKLLAVGGAWCGWPALPFIVLIASGTGLIAALFPSMRAHADAMRIPFGPFLSLGIFLTWIVLQFAPGL